MKSVLGLLLSAFLFTQPVYAQSVVLGSNAGVGIGGTVDTTIADGNAIVDNYDTTLLPGGTPDAWGRTTLAFSVGAASANAASARPGAACWHP